MTDPSAAKAAALRAPFPAEAVGKLPKISCGKCSQSQTKNCDSHRKAECRVCGNWITSAHIHLDYVGHAATTDRLLSVDNGWTWEPVALDQRGLPCLDENGGLWIRLTVMGITRLGYGDSAGKRGPSAIKEAIGDAIRNGAMRFGVALDLWAKEDISATTPYIDEPVQHADPVTPPELTRPVERLTTTPDDDPWAQAPVASEPTVTTSPARVRDSGPKLRNPDGPPSDKARGMMFALLKSADGKARPRDESLAIIAGILGREVESSSDLTAQDVSDCIDALQAASAAS